MSRTRVSTGGPWTGPLPGPARSRSGIPRTWPAPASSSVLPSLACRRVRRLPLLPHPIHQLHELVRIGQRHLSLLCRPTNPDLDGPELLVGILGGVGRLVNVGPRGLDPPWRVDGVFLVDRVGECGFAVLLDSLPRVGIGPTMDFSRHDSPSLPRGSLANAIDLNANRSHR